MDIKKSEILNHVRSLTQTSNQKKTKQNIGSSSANSNLLNKPNDSLDLHKFRGTIVKLQSELKLLQNQLSYDQIQSSYLEKNDLGSRWKQDLGSFLKKNLSEHLNKFIQNTEKDIEHFDKPAKYLLSIRQKIQTTTSHLMSKEIKIQNILSSGIEVNEDIPLISERISKDISSAKDIFSKLKPDNIKNLLNS